MVSEQPERVAENSAEVHEPARDDGRLEAPRQYLGVRR
jgi:hypothetical protein